MAGMLLTEKDKDALRSVLEGNVTFYDMQKTIITEYKQPGIAYERV
jgi:hypothetical protein